MKKIILSKCFLHVVLLTLAFCLFPVLPAFAQEDIVDRLDKALGVTLPSEYKGKVKAFVQGSKVLEGIGAIPTERFIKEQMKENWGIMPPPDLAVDSPIMGADLDIDWGIIPPGSGSKTWGYVAMSANLDSLFFDIYCYF